MRAYLRATARRSLQLKLAWTEPTAWRRAEGARRGSAWVLTAAGGGGGGTEPTVGTRRVPPQREQVRRACSSAAGARVTAKIEGRLRELALPQAPTV